KPGCDDEIPAKDRSDEQPAIAGGASSEVARGAAVSVVRNSKTFEI
ncbi:unnamed protein product, partial [Allacma fusca]